MLRFLQADVRAEDFGVWLRFPGRRGLQGSWEHLSQKPSVVAIWSRVRRSSRLCLRPQKIFVNDRCD